MVESSDLREQVQAPSTTNARLAEENERTALLRKEIIEVLQTIYDPEIPVSIYDLGLIYDIEIYHDDSVTIRMTLTAPNCPAAEILPGEVQSKVQMLPRVVESRVDLVFEPSWSPARMSEEAKLELGLL